MKIHFSDFFEISEKLLEEYGAINISLINDLPLFIDPFLLFNSPKREYQELHKSITTYVRFLREISLRSSIDPGLLNAWFTFPEVKQTWLGFSKSGNRGHGLGSKFARALNFNLHSVFTRLEEEEITQSSHLEKLCLVREGIGRDNISDFTTNLIVDFLADYTQAFAKNNLSPDQTKLFSVSKAWFNYDTRTWVNKQYTLPCFDGDYVLLVPSDILTKDETWINRRELTDNFQEIAKSLSNETLRAQINEYFLRKIPDEDVDKATVEDIKKAVDDTIKKFPIILDLYIKSKEENKDQATLVAQEKVLGVRTIFIENIKDLVSNYLEPLGFYENGYETYDEACNRISLLKEVIEKGSGNKLFYMDGRPISREDELKIFFRLVWFAKDFKTIDDFSQFNLEQECSEKVFVEFKLAKNPKLKYSLEKYDTESSEPTNVNSHIIVIFYFDDRQLSKVKSILRDLNHTKNIFIIDARPKKENETISQIRLKLGRRKSLVKRIKIFLAHASEDSSKVMNLYNRLKEEGYGPWMDKKDLMAGQNWRQEIPKAIKDSDIFIACLSSNSIDKQGYIQREFKMALNKYAEKTPGTIYLIPLRLDKCEIPELRQEEYGVNLKDIQWLDYFEEDGFANLIRAIEHQFNT